MPAYFKPDERKICIVPNKRMLDMTSNNDASEYLNLLSRCINILLDKNFDPFLLVHAGNEDEEVAGMIMNKTKKRIEIIHEGNVLYIKGIIGSVGGLIGSRYHSLVSALSQNIPALGSSWSHKYITLFEDYHFDNLDSLDWDKVFEILPIYHNKRMEKKVREYFEHYKSTNI